MAVSGNAFRGIIERSALDGSRAVPSS
jgi:hypothetical protein